ncbi:MAG: YidC/Oxa1 family membrane protein insertase [Patescibacteria group bacterium]
MKAFFFSVFYQPLLNVLWLLFLVLPGHSFGLAVIALTLIINVLLLPLNHKAKLSQRAMQALEPELKAIQKQYKDNKEELARKTWELYGKYKVNPFSGVLYPLVQIPVFIALYRVFSKGSTFQASHLYSFVPSSIQPEAIFLNAIDLTKASLSFSGFPPKILSYSGLLLALCAGVAIFFQNKVMLTKKPEQEQNEFARAMNTQARYFIPGLIFVISTQTPAALSLYFTTSSLFGIVHEVLLQRRVRNHGTDKQ